MSADSEALAGNWFAVPNTFHQAVADYGVLVLSCAEHASRGLRRRCRATSSGAPVASSVAAWQHPRTHDSVGNCP